MKTTNTILILLSLIMTLTACDFLTNSNEKEVFLNLSHLEKELAQADNEFSFNLLQKMAEDETGNLFISPLSVSMAFGMVYNGASGETRDEIAELLGLADHSPQEINDYYHKMIKTLPKLDNKVKFEIANSIWIREGFPVEQKFLDMNQDYFHAEVDNLDFSDSKAIDKINNWVADATNDKIKRIVDEIPSDVIMYLINALYFKGDWSSKFKKSNTYEDDFHCQDGSVNKVDMMSQTDKFNYWENDKIQVIDLPYGDEKFSMTVLLPKKSENIDNYLQQLSADDWASMLSNMRKREVQLYLPKFELEYKKELTKVLKALGLNAPFDAAVADFTAMSPEYGRQLVIDQVLHKTYLKVNEEGSEAAAVTSVSMRVTSVMPENIVMKVNRPFLLAIRERENGTILFTGRINELEK